MPVRLVTTTARTPPGQLRWAAWQALQEGPVLVVGADHPQQPALAEAGVKVQVLDPAAVVSRLTSPRQPGPYESRVVLPPPDDAQLAEALRAAGVVVEELAGAVDPPGARLLDVVALMDRLRSPGGCPWDAAQTHASLRPYLLEEAYEACEALDEDDLDALREELGDVLLQVVFHARLAQEGPRPWSVDDVAQGLVDKLVRRHPHVFAGAPADDLEGSWAATKAAESAEKGRTSVTEGVPLGQPALTLAATLQRRGRRLGAPVPSYAAAASSAGGAQHAPDHGARLWELVRACAADGVDPEEALRLVARRYRDDLAAAERSARADGEDPATLDADGWHRRWTAATRA